MVTDVRDDVIRFDKDLFENYAALKNAMSAHKGGVLIEAGDGAVFLDKIKIHTLDADDFLFA